MHGGLLNFEREISVENAIRIKTRKGITLASYLELSGFQSNTKFSFE